MMMIFPWSSCGPDLLTVCSSSPHQSPAPTFVLEILGELLGDPESDVRAATVSKLPACAAKVSDKVSFLESMEERMKRLVNDPQTVVKSALAANILKIGPGIGPELTVQYLIGPCLELLKDETASEVGGYDSCPLKEGLTG